MEPHSGDPDPRTVTARQRRLRVNSSLRTDSRSLTMDPWKAEEYFAVACLRPAYEYFHVQ